MLEASGNPSFVVRGPVSSDSMERHQDSTPIQWLSTREAAEYLGVTLRTLYRFIDEGQLAAYQFGRVIRLKTTDVENFIAASRISPGSLRHLYPESKTDTTLTEVSHT